MFKSLCSVCVASVLAASAGAVELDRIDRSIRREPCYQDEPKYALLVFGREAKTRVWLVMDGKVLYVDRNANGDLTERDERFTPDAVSSTWNGATWFRVPDITEPDAVRHTSLAFGLLPNDEFRLNILARDEVFQFVGLGASEKPTLDPDPRSAPTIHLDGPLTFGMYGPPPTATTDEASGVRRASLRLILGTPGWGAGTFAGVRSSIRQDKSTLGYGEHYRITVEEPRYVLTHKHLPLELEYLSRSTGDRARLPLECQAVGGCGGIITVGPLTIPSDAASGVIQARIAYPKSKNESLMPASMEIVLP